MFSQHTYSCCKLENIGQLSLGDLEIKREHIPDFYLFDTAGSWTYVFTHEPDCGPYFYKK